MTLVHDIIVVSAHPRWTYMHEDMADFEDHVSYTLELCMSIALCPVALYYFNLLNLRKYLQAAGHTETFNFGGLGIVNQERNQQ